MLKRIVTIAAVLLIALTAMAVQLSAAAAGQGRVSGAVGATDFYFAEGTCRPDFDTYFCIQNPGDLAAEVAITYMKADGSIAPLQLTVAPHSRSTVTARDTLGTGNDPSHDFSTRVECTNGQQILAERPMYFNYNGVWTGGHDVIGTSTPGDRFMFAEGTCRPNFDTYFCVFNPGGLPAEVALTYSKGDGETATDNVTVAPRSRSTVNARTVLGTGDDPAHDFATDVRCLNGQNIVVERPMYFNFNGVWTGGHDVIGVAPGGGVWHFAEGTCRPGFETFICIQPFLVSSGGVNAEITYMKGDGTSQVQTVPVQNNVRTTVRVKDLLGEGDDASHDFSISIELKASSPVTGFQDQMIVERPMYFAYKGAWTGGHDVTASLTATEFYFAEGTCRPGFDPYLCILNAGNAAAGVRITYMKGDGATVTQDVEVAKGTRATISIKDKLGQGDDPAHDFSIKAECTNGQQILVERPMYFNYQGAWTGGSDVVGAH